MFIAWILTFLFRGNQHILKRKYVALTLLLEIIRQKQKGMCGHQGTRAKNVVWYGQVDKILLSKLIRF